MSTSTTTRIKVTRRFNQERRCARFSPSQVNAVKSIFTNKTFKLRFGRKMIGWIKYLIIKVVVVAVVLVLVMTLVLSGLETFSFLC